MSDDLIKRLGRCFNGLEGLQTDQGDYGVLAEAATALAEAQATIARLHDQVGDWIVRADEANARADRMESALRGLMGAVIGFEAGRSGGLALKSAMHDAAAALAQGKVEGV